MFKPGDKKPEKAGRKEGTTNLRTREFLEVLRAKDFHTLEKIVAMISDPSSDLMDKERLDAMLRLLDFEYPKRKAVEHSGEIKQDIGIDGVLAKVIKDVQNGKS